MRKRTWKFSALLVSLLLVLTVTVGGTLAYLVTKTDAIQNIFNPTRVTTQVNETIVNDNGTLKKTNVTIQNTGTTDAYIRAAVVITWQDENGNVYGQMPVDGTDYTINWNLAGENQYGWVKAADGFYYWTSPVAPDGFTGILIQECKPVEGKAPSGYYLTVEILGSGIQSVPTSVVTEEWESGVAGIKSEGKTLDIKPYSTTGGN